MSLKAETQMTLGAMTKKSVWFSMEPSVTSSLDQ